MVADHELLAITAIKDMEQEGALAASLVRSGWKVLYRSTSPESLLANITRFPDVLLLLSDDFIAPEKIQFKNTILLRGLSEPIGREGVEQPKSDFELGELIRNRTRGSAPEKVLIPATQSRVIAVASKQGGVGTTTLALNAADQISLTGKRVLLVDASSSSSALAEHCEIHDIRSDAKEFKEGLFLCEISEISQLLYLASIAQEFDCIVIDLGLLSEPSLSGNRLFDKILHWIIYSQGTFILIASNFKKNLDRTERAVKKLKEIAPAIKVDIAITLDSAMSRRERMKLESEIFERSSSHATIFSRDHRAIEATREQAATLHMSAPRSTINREIGEFVRERLILE
ncbi:CpaE-like domain containing protein [Candidatus Nanopelagicaceae bacterium]